MGKKNLSNYFDNWYYVAVNIQNLTHEEATNDVGMHDWCTKNVGLKNLKWDCRWISFPNDDSKMRSLTKNRWCYIFKYDEDAMMFILTFGGEIIEKYPKK